MTAPDESTAEPAPPPIMGRAMDAWDAADWDAYRAAHTPDLIVIDHRPASLGALDGRDSYLDATRAMREMFTAASSRIIEQRRVGPDGGIARARITCFDDSEREIEIEFVGLSTLRDGLIERMELFAPDQIDEATARLDELRRQAHQEG